MCRIHAPMALGNRRRELAKGSTPRNGRSTRSSQRKDDARSQDGGATRCANTSGEEGTPGRASKPRFPADEMETYRLLLLKKRLELVGDVDHMEAEALKKNRMDATGDLSMMPIHMADIGTDNYEQEFTIELISGEQETLKEIDAALARIRAGTYGICEGTHKAIPKARLKAKPWARYRVEHKRFLEENGRR